MRFLGILLILLSILIQANNKPSWCNHARLYVEKRICIDPELMNLESELLSAYRFTRDRLSKNQQKILRHNQSRWIKTRNKTCDGKSNLCIKKFYVRRIEELENSIANKKKSHITDIIDQFKNATYKNIEKYPITLTDGEWLQNDSTGLIYNSVKFSEILLSGDLDRNGHREYMVLLYQSGGGSGIFSYLAVMSKSGNRFINLDTVFLGDRTDILSAQIQNNNLVLTIKDHGPNDPMCCPTRVAQHIWRLENNHLKKIKDPNKP